MVSVNANDYRLCLTKGRYLLAWAVCVALMLIASISQAKSVDSTKAFAPYQVKAAYLYYFAKFTEWPEGTAQVEADEFSICLLGEDDIATALNSLTTRTVHHQRVGWRRISSSGAAAGCHIVYIGAKQKEYLQPMLQALQQFPVLTISDSKGFAAAGGMVELAQKGNKIHFSINLQAAKQQNLRLNPYLLKLASIVEEGA